MDTNFAELNKNQKQALVVLALDAGDMATESLLWVFGLESVNGRHHWVRDGLENGRIYSLCLSTQIPVITPGCDFNGG